MVLESERRRSVAFIDDGPETWACFLVTFPNERDWHGYFSFRPSDGELDDDEVRTANIFIESCEADIYEKARSLGRPLLKGLFESARHTRARERPSGHGLRARFRSLLADNSVDLAGDWTEEGLSVPLPDEIERLRSMYASYRLDQVAHFICLVHPKDFEAAVDKILEGASVDFRAKDRVQFAMLVVDHIEGLIPLPDFEAWSRDYLAHPEAYRLYTHTLHRERRLP
jgi:hypothetical protein